MSTPLTPSRIRNGFLYCIVILLLPHFGLFTLIMLANFFSQSASVVLSNALFFPLQILLVAGVVLWASTAVNGFGARCGASLLLLSLLWLPAFVGFTGGSLAWLGFHPMFAWVSAFSDLPPRFLWINVGILVAINALLFLGYGPLYRFLNSRN